MVISRAHLVHVLHQAANVLGLLVFLPPHCIVPLQRSETRRTIYLLLRNRVLYGCSALSPFLKLLHTLLTPSQQVRSFACCKAAKLICEACAWWSSNCLHCFGNNFLLPAVLSVLLPGVPRVQPCQIRPDCVAREQRESREDIQTLFLHQRFFLWHAFAAPPSLAAPPSDSCTNSTTLDEHNGETEEDVQFQLDYGAHFSSPGDGLKELRVTLSLDGVSGTGDMQGIAVKDLPRPKPDGLTVSNIILDPPISSTETEYPDFIIGDGNVSDASLPGC